MDQLVHYIILIKVKKNQNIIIVKWNKYINLNTHNSVKVKTEKQ